MNRYLRSLVESASGWITGAASVDYPGYDKVIAGLARETYETQVAKGAAWAGTPERILETISRYREQIGFFEVASLQVNFNDLPLAAAESSMRLFGEHVLPRLARERPGVAI